VSWSANYDVVMCNPVDMLECKHSSCHGHMMQRLPHMIGCGEELRTCNYRLDRHVCNSCLVCPACDVRLTRLLACVDFCASSFQAWDATDMFEGGPRGYAIDLVETKCSVTTSRRLCRACTSTKRNVNLPVQIQPNRPLCYSV
jgi:hypothetical protein